MNIVKISEKIKSVQPKEVSVPAYEDKYSRSGIRAADILDEAYLEERLDNVLLQKQVYTELTDKKEFNKEYLMEYIDKYRKMLGAYIKDTHYLLNDYVNSGKSILFEGAQGTMLDIDHGTYPFVTSSNCIGCASAIGSGASVKNIGNIIGLMKAYISRVGTGPFPTELNDEVGQKIRDIGQEYGATTGRPRRVGWFDAVMSKYSAMINGLDFIALTRLDILNDFDELKIATHYELDGEKIEHWPQTLSAQERVIPIYETLPGWKEDITHCRSF